MRLLLAGLLIVAFPATADESSVYESLDAVSIGRVFLTPGERHWLDANRDLALDSAEAASTVSEEGEASETGGPVPAGFIINSSGEVRRYRDGEFSPSGASSYTMRFPDDVEIQRHEPERDSDAESESDETAGN